MNAIRYQVITSSYGKTLCRYFGISSIVERRFCDIGYSASGYSSVSIAIGASYFFAFSAVEYISRGILLHRSFAFALGAKNYMSVLICAILMFHSVTFVPSKEMGQ